MITFEVFMLNVDHIQKAPNLAWLAKKTCELYQDLPAVTMVLANGMNGTLSYKELDEKSDQLAFYLREKLKLPAGSAVAIQMPNCLSYPIATLGVFKAGLVLVNVNPLYTVTEMIHQLNDSESVALITVDLFKDKAAVMLDKTKVQKLIIVQLPEFLPYLPKKIAQLVIRYWNKQVPRVSAPFISLKECLRLGSQVKKEKNLDVSEFAVGLNHQSVAVLQYTGGTTGVSKGAILTHGNLISNMNQLLIMLKDRLNTKEENVLTALPLYHIFAFTVNFWCFFVIGARNILCPNPRPISNLQRALENYPISVISGVNTLYNALNLEDWFMETPPPKLKLAVAGGMSLHLSVAEAFKKITNIDIIEGYGLTETSPAVCFNPFDKPKEGSIGLPLPQTEMKLVDDSGQTVTNGEPGELLIKGPQVMPGYWKRPEETAKSIRDGWFATGDIAAQDADGYYKIVDRKKDMILISGFNVYPNEVEEVLAEHPQVLECAVIGVPDGASGEAVKAYIVLKSETVPSNEDLRTHCKSKLVAYKTPKYFEFRKELPKSPIGKILRKELRNELIKGASK
jgi:long-chain acyl-CoA synthetase